MISCRLRKGFKLELETIYSCKMSNLVEKNTYHYKQILEYRPDIEDQQKQGKTTLILAAEHNQREAAQVLLDHGAQLFTLDNLKENPLHLAARRNRVRVLRTLFKANDIDKFLEHKNKLGETPLGVAVKHRHVEFAQILIGERASVHVANNERINLLEMAVKNNLLDFLSKNTYQFDRQDVEFRDWRDQTPLQIANETRLAAFAWIFEGIARRE